MSLSWSHLPVVRPRQRRPTPRAPLRKRNARARRSHNQEGPSRRCKRDDAYLRRTDQNLVGSHQIPPAAQSPERRCPAGVGRRGRATSGTRALGSPRPAFCSPPRTRPCPGHAPDSSDHRDIGASAAPRGDAEVPLRQGPRRQKYFLPLWQPLLVLSLYMLA